MIKLLTLKIGMNIVSEIDEIGSTVILKKPAVVITQQQDGQLAVGFSPFLELCEEFDKGISIDKSEFLTITTPNTELQNQYSKYFGSGIQIATADSIPK
jgi:hypothetical protein